MAKKQIAAWPTLKTYDQDHLLRVALPIGGIGTGTISLRGRGGLVNWEIMNRPAKGFTPPLMNGWAPFFCVRAQTKEGIQQKLLEGPLEDYEYEGSSGSPAPCHNMPRFRKVSFETSYPFGRVQLSDAAFPLSVKLEAFNPLIPGDAESSGIPVAVLRYVLKNTTASPVRACIAGSIPNFIGCRDEDVVPYGPRTDAGSVHNHNTFRTGKMIRGISFESGLKKSDSDAWGTMALTTTAKGPLTHRTAWPKRWGNETHLDFWDDLIADGKLDPREQHAEDHQPVGSLAVPVTIPAHAERAVTFLITWHFPNRWPWGQKKSAKEKTQAIVGNWYATQYKDAWDVAESVAARLPELEKKTTDFVRAFVNTDLPTPVKEAALFNLSTLRTETCFRTTDGRFFGWEGTNDKEGSCFGNCTHVWNYEQATAFLFGSLSRSMRDTEYTWMTNKQGHMAFRCGLPLGKKWETTAAADGQMGCLMKLYRDWQLSGDDDMLRTLWPAAKKSLAFTWIKNGWDGDTDGVMEGCQHNTMDVEYYGPNGQMQIWYLGALRAVEEMSRYLGDNAFAKKVNSLYEKGSAWADKHLFNGSYYEQKISSDRVHVADGLRLGMLTKGETDPAYQQLGTACLIDQLVGQYMAHVCGLGYLVNKSHIKKTLTTILKNNRRKGFFDHFNPMRSYVVGDETALLMASYPQGERPRLPFPYFGEVMTGFEYTVAAHCLFEGMEKEGLNVYQDIRARYDGRRRSPFDEAECGHHYARAMASWAGVIAWTGFGYSGVTKTLRIGAREGRFFWSNGDAWGTYELTAKEFRLSVLSGALKIAHLVLEGQPEVPFRHTITAGKTQVYPL